MMKQQLRHRILLLNSISLLFVLLFVFVSLPIQAQIKISGNIYGGGNEGKVEGSTTVTIHAGDLNNVFGGARMADVDGSAFVNIDGEHASDYVIINKLYGGNDIAGTIGSSEALPDELTSATEDGVDNSWNAFVHISTKTDAAGKETDDAQKIYIGQLFGGGNGDYDYTTTYSGKSSPVLAKTYLDVQGGSIVYAYGGGNNATVTSNTVISVNNPSKVVNSIKDKAGNELLTNDRFQKQMGINTGFSYPSSDAFQIGRFFGGNNKAEMAIRPTWNLKSGKIRNLYSGGNEGAMTHREGLLLEIPATSTIIVDNVYGGCRMADVHPLNSGTLKSGVYEETASEDIQLPSGLGYKFPAGLPARVLVRGGDIRNVYGGNDVTGKVFGGNAVGIYTSIRGDVYGGGNGSYPYTDKEEMRGDDIYSDLYYNPGENSSVEALNAFRPNAEQVAIRLKGEENKPTIIHGSVYCGGNSATIMSEKTNPMVELKIGSYVIADNVFLGNNGEHMVDEDILKHYAGNVDSEGNLVTSGGKKFSSLNLTDGNTFAKYMEGAAMSLMPSVTFDQAPRDPATYIPYSSSIGSFYCGGNVGSMTIKGKTSINFDDKIIVYDKVVGGCNNANVAKTDYNAAYEGGLLGSLSEQTNFVDENGKIKDRLELNFSGLKIQPKRWNADKTELVWHTIKASTGEEVHPTGLTTGTSTAEDLDRRLKGGNIYGGCYNTGHVNGNVVINLNASIVDRKGEFAIFDQITENEGEAILYANDSFEITERRSGVILDRQGMDVLGKALNVFGGGYGSDSEIWGSTTINLNAGYTFQIFGGGEKGAIGKGVRNAAGKLEYSEYDPRYSCYVNLRGDYEGVYRGHNDDNANMAEAEFIYGGAFEAPIVGNTVINLGNGRIFNSFAGSCNADILGHTETYIGRQVKSDGSYTDGGGFPWIRDHVYGGNDLGGHILNTQNFIDRVNADIKDKVYNPTNIKDSENNPTPVVTNASAYMEYQKGRVDYIFGGCYGVYDYKDRYFANYADADGNAINGFTKPRMENAFVNFRPYNHTRNAVTKIYGAGQGYSGDSDRDIMQNRSYVLIDIPQNSTNFQEMEVFGAGDFCGIGMRNESALNPEIAKTNADGVTASTVIDLMRGQVKDVFGASYKEGVTRRTIVNVPVGSTISAKRIFGGAYGVTNEKPCDVIEAHINYNSGDALVGGYRTGIFGGNNSYRRTFYSFVNINAPLFYDKNNDYVGTVFGGGYGANTWSQYTEVNLNDGARVYEVYGGGYGGMVLNEESVNAYNTYTEEVGEGDEKTTVTKNVYKNIGNGYTSEAIAELANSLVQPNKLGTKCNATVNINQGANVSGYLYNGTISGGYCYAGGYGATATVSGSTYIGLHGGTVIKDLYAGGTSGAVMDLFKLGTFTATTNAYIEGGTVRNVYGGGWEGDVGYHDKTTTATTNDVLGKTNVVIGIRQDQASLPDGYGYLKGVPAIQRNAYGGGEGGAIFGQTNLTFNNGYIGYTFDADANKYEEKVNDETWSDHVGKDRLSDCGNLFGGGYDDNSSVDESHVLVWGGIVRNSVFGGGEIATIGRGKTKESGEDNKVRVLEAIYKPGETNIEIYNGHVKRNVFGGGKGYNILGYGGVHGFYTDGYVFGKTEVHIHGGEIGTDEGLAQGYGNVFGGGDVGYVYGKGYFNENSGKTNTGSPNHYYYYDENGKLTEDCKVLVAPMLQVKKDGTKVTFDGQDYFPYDYVPTEYLNTLPADKNDSRWKNLYTGDKNADGSVNPDDPQERGIHIHNAVFAGGNVSSNSESYNNATTVFGNTTATLYDVYHHDFITVGTEHTGGLYGGGNLSLVGGYRELNITNYGTDYYGLDQQISLEEYRKLTNRERAYFKLEYLCQQDITINGKNYKKDERIDEDEYNALPAEYKSEAYWIQYGFCSIYAGRLLNTIQRADFCGVFGSRLVLQGSKDRVADVADATEYTINRVGELSLNQQRFKSNDDSELHGNYFGIYSVVNYLGNLTSDVHFEDPRRYVENGVTKVDTKNYYKYKVDHLDKRDRNNGTSYNQVALASGVFLELTSENSTPSNKIYGDITGVVELDLINVKKNIEGGGYVYARNEHGLRSEVSHVNTLLSEYNQKNGDEALTKKIYTYSSTNLLNHQTSGNFIHKSKRIVDDCYPNNGIYNDGYKKSPAHYWFIKGEVYIYDQVVSAYAGSASAYSKEVKIPLTITAGSNGRLKLLNVQPNLYAYYANDERSTKINADGVKVDNESMTYYLNDVISWWDWHQLSQNEQKLFVKETYVNVDTCYVGGVKYPSGTYVLENDASIHGGDESKTAYQMFLNNHPAVLDNRNNEVTDLTQLFHPSNNIAHDTGYVLTLDMNSPKDWDSWYSPANRNDGEKIGVDSYKLLSAAGQDKYRKGPTYTLTGSSGLYGQREYSVGEIISKEVYDDYTNTVSLMSPKPAGQAVAEQAYVALADYGNIQAGSAIGVTEYNASGNKSNFQPAMVCINTIQLGDENYVLLGELVPGTDANLETLAQKYKTYNNSKTNADKLTDAEALEYVKSNLSPAYYIKSDGLYGGQYFQEGQNYSAIKSWCSLTDARDNFGFNYDAFDVLIDPLYHGEGYTETYYHSPYSDVKPVEYEAAYAGTGTLTYYDNDNEEHTIAAGEAISREAYEKVRNDQLHYTRIQVAQGADEQTVYIVNETMINNGTPYAKGQDISEKDYKALSDENKNKVDVVTFQKESTATVKYYCYEAYTPATTFTTERGAAGEKGSVISSLIFNDSRLIPNYQNKFSIQGSEPTETTTLYVSRESNAKDVTSEKVISVVYQYTYYEADDEGEGVSLVNELHVLNIHLQLESGAPEIGPLTAPPAVLPGNTLGVKAPTVNPGLYEVLTSGWELFNSEEDAMLHRNGIPFTNNGTPLYWYQNQKVFLAFYSKTYLGKAYSNYVPLSVANYHDLDAVMKDKEHHLYVDHPNVMRNSKIYIDNRTCESDPTKSELDLFKDFFDLSVNGLDGHSSLDSHVKGGDNLEFILNSNVAPKAYTTWIPIGNDTQCFEGNLHGDGYTISGLSNTLFGNLCGNVYNLGVTGSFNSAGVVDKGVGYVENSWINTTGTPAASTKAVFGNPTDHSAEQVVNCYYPETNAYAEGAAIKKPERAFYNGEVAYNLNGFYLYKRYSDQKVSSGREYNYLVYNADGELSDLQTGYYGSNPANCSSGYNGLKYVEDRYADGDFRYADGTIPETMEERMRTIATESSVTTTFAPIWPDDYLFFGQNLNYGWGGTHQDEPGHFTGTNRVYRAPAYYGSKKMSAVHYNPNAYIVANSKPLSLTDTNLKDAYPYMTAVDFAGHNDALSGASSYGLGMQSDKFYPPLLDDAGLTAVTTNGETQNLLVYAPSTAKNQATYDVLSAYFTEPAFEDSYDEANYRRVAETLTSGVLGHLVMSDKIAANDHLLVDKQEFNCPIAYSFDNDKRMWYQRKPDNYVDDKKGWEAVSLPFTAELVTTQQKGEITHFYEGSTKGHEYWLREFKGGSNSTIEENVFVANFSKLSTGSDTKEDANTFLWDYYYSKQSRMDENTDIYQEYYKGKRTYNNYPYGEAGTPYIVGFPGRRYYEFDLSGQFEPEHTYAAISQLDRQTITFASQEGASVAVSDDELGGVSQNGYTFMPNYKNKSLAVDAYMLASDGGSFDKTTAATTLYAFRPYFKATEANGARVRRIVFSNDESELQPQEEDRDLRNESAGTLIIYAKKQTIVVESTLKEAADVTIYNTAGLSIASFTIQPGETIETRDVPHGVYIVQTTDGRRTKKLAVK